MSDPVEASDPSIAATHPDELCAAPDKPLPDAARRALEEAAERRAAINAKAEESAPAPEKGGPKGLEPTRYGDWEHKGLAIDFS